MMSRRRQPKLYNLCLILLSCLWQINMFKPMMSVSINLWLKFRMVSTVVFVFHFIPTVWYSEKKSSPNAYFPRSDSSKWLLTGKYRHIHMWWTISPTFFVLFRSKWANLSSILYFNVLSLWHSTAIKINYIISY